MRVSRSHARHDHKCRDRNTTRHAGHLRHGKWPGRPDGSKPCSPALAGARRVTGWSTPTCALENVLDHHGQARPIDFDDASWGHYAQDLAIAADNIPEELHPVLLGGGAGAAPGCRDLARAAARSAPQSRNQGSQR